MSRIVSQDYQLTDTPELVMLNDDSDKSSEYIVHINIKPENPESVFEYVVCHQTDLDSESFKYTTVKGHSKTTHQLKPGDESWYLVLKCKSIIVCNVTVDRELIDKPAPPSPPTQVVQPRPPPAQLQPPRRTSPKPKQTPRPSPRQPQPQTSWWLSFDVEYSTMVWVCLGVIVGIAMALYFGWGGPFMSSSTPSVPQYHSAATIMSLPSSVQSSRVSTPAPSLVSEPMTPNATPRVRSVAASEAGSTGSFVDELRSLNI